MIQLVNRFWVVMSIIKYHIIPVLYSIKMIEFILIRQYTCPRENQQWREGTEATTSHQNVRLY